MGEISNPAVELHKLCLHFSQIEYKYLTKEAIATSIGTETDSPEFFSLLAALSLRFNRFDNLIAISGLPSQHKSVSLNASHQLRLFFSATYLAHTWSDVRQKIFDNTHMTAMFMIGPALQAIAPIYVPNIAERNDFVENLTSAIGDLAKNADAVSDMLRLSLQTLVRMIAHLDLYGAELLPDELISAFALVEHAESRQGANNSGGISKAKAALVAIMFAIVTADSALTSLENFYTRGQFLISHLASHLPSSPKLLTGPSGQKPEPSDTQQDYAIVPDRPKEPRRKDQK